MEKVAAHIEDEENNLFPGLHRGCSSEMLGDLREQIRRAKAMAPTRPHPAAHDTP
ncbi:hypothetical protein ABZ468_47125 [Streptomyces sp. NPDC005708]|uniref:hypothetical protein n=1 Tax=Streptomyces sp. NPDC005708 TaxID=3154564 RepID=UPI0033EDA57C